MLRPLNFQNPKKIPGHRPRRRPAGTSPGTLCDLAGAAKQVPKNSRFKPEKMGIQQVFTSILQEDVN